MNALLQGAIRSLEAHPAVESVTIEEAVDGGATARAIFRVNLPSRWAAAGGSPNGVRSREEVLFEFPPNFPESAPRITLREDFADTLPHTYLHKKGERVPPCITFGDKRDVMHSDGIISLVDQMSDWLDKAALDQLAENEHGWEPSRRDVGFNFLEMDIHRLNGRPPFGGWRMFMCTATWSKNGLLSLARDPQAVSPLNDPGFMRDLPTTLKDDGVICSARVPLVFCWPQADTNGLPEVNAQYKADKVTTFAELAEQATEWRCRVALDDFVSNFNRLLGASKSRVEIILYLAFPIRRPKHVIGTQSEFEVMAYRISFVLGAKLSAADNTPVTPVAFISPVSGALLRRTSALREDVGESQLTFVGCGSLGSKLLMHVARAGSGAALLVDEKRLVAHNVARHVLLPEDVGRLQGKAERLANIVTSFGAMRPKVFGDDIRELDFSSAKFRGFFGGGRCLVVNTTGSPSVREFLAKATFEARVMESALMNHGTAAFMTVEGPGRNPSTTDLIYHAYERLRGVGALKQPTDSKESVLEIGVGCHSVTIPMSDARVSLIAAGVGQKLLEFGQDGLPDEGVTAVSTVGSDGMSITWSVDHVGPTQIARVYDDEGWAVRVLDAAHEKILNDVDQYPGVETGGLIVGNISPLTRQIVITDILPAAPDSTRSASRFVLGVQGTVDSIREYESLGGRTLWCLGTWHSHLAVSGPSPMDRDTARLLDGTLRYAAVLLIRHPEGYAALVRDGTLG